MISVEQLEGNFLANELTGCPGEYNLALMSKRPCIFGKKYSSFIQAYTWNKNISGTMAGVRAIFT